MNERESRGRWSEIGKIFDAALEHEPAARPGYLDEACGDDAGLRTEVESLLAAHDRAGDYLERSATSVHEAIAAGGYRPGQRIGRYRLIREIGRGGLGLVYLAADTRLDRQVALKFLPVLRAGDPEARARFEREVRAASSLDHPGICTVYDIGEAAGDPFIAMAYVEGETLRERIARGPLPLAEAADFASQIAAGVAHAHGQGIVHRDIKPANVIITPAGDAMLVDFGLARGVDASTLTREGATPGTVSYMSPEQIRGEEIDGRTDVWALGVVLYEMIAGRRPFGGETEQSRIWAILNRDPEPLTAVRAGVPLALEPIVAKALAKDRARRYQHVDELPVDLRAALDDSAVTIPGTRYRVSRHGRRLVIAAVLAGLAAGAALGWLLPRLGRHAPRQPVQLAAVLPAGQRLSPGSRRIAISPDGSLLAFTARGDGRDQLRIRALDGSAVRAIPGTDDARDPFFSPNGRQVGYFAHGGLFKVSLDGGRPQKIADAPSETNRGASWGSDGMIVFPRGQWSGLFRVSDAGGDPEALTVPDKARSAHYFPQILADGRGILYTIWDTAGWKTALLDVESGHSTEVAESCAAAHYVESGHIVCVEMEGLLTTGSLLAATFDPRRPARRGAFVSLPRLSGLVGFDFAASATGTLVYVERAGARTALASVDRAGTVSIVADDADHYRTPAVSPEGRWIAVTRVVVAGRQELWLYDPGSAIPARLSTTGNVNNMPVWSPDGARVVFNSVRQVPGLYSVAPGTGDDASLILRRAENIQVPSSFSPDGRLLAFTELDGRTLGDLWVFSFEDGSRTPMLQTPANERGAVFSKDGRWIAYTSNESGRDEVWVRPWPGPGASVQVSTGGGAEPAWSRDDNELFYRQGEAMIAVPVRPDPTFSAAAPRTLFTGAFATEYIGGARQYDVLPDGRFLMVAPEPDPEPIHIEVVLDWFDELERIVRTER